MVSSSHTGNFLPTGKILSFFSFKNSISPSSIVNRARAQTVLSQWYPTKGLYKGRDVEGMYLLKTLPFLPPGTLRMVPKQLVDGCRVELETLKAQIFNEYRIGNKERESWEKWFKTHIPEREDAAEYIKTHHYTCPLISFFWQGVKNTPSWNLSAPECSFSIFPSTVAIAMPSATCQFDRGGAFPAYRNIGNINENIVDAHSKYSEHYRIGEESRLKKIGGKLLKEIVNRKVKEFGGRYPSSGSVTKLVDLIIDCNINFFSTRYLTAPPPPFLFIPPLCFT